MTFAAREESRQRGEPVGLFLFTYGAGAGAFYAYTDAESAITIGIPAVTYEPMPISRGPLQSTGTLDKSALDIRMPITAGLSDMFLVWPPSEVVSLVIRHGHVNDTAAEFLAVWSGRVLSGGREGSEAVFRCEPITTSLRRNGLRRHYQFGCPHVLYGDQCQASKAAATVATTAEAVAGRTVTVPSGWPGAAASAEFLGGLVEWTTAAGNRELRTILRVTGGRTFLLSGLASDLAVAGAVDVVKGCAHTMTACTDVHANIHNFGGQPWIPLRSPFGFRNEFY